MDEKMSNRLRQACMKSEAGYGIDPFLVEEAYERIEELEAALSSLPRVTPEPVAMRFGWDGYGYQYIDNASGSDWRTRHKDAEPLYAMPVQRTLGEDEAVATLKEDLRILYWAIGIQPAHQPIGHVWKIAKHLLKKHNIKEGGPASYRALLSAGVINGGAK